MNEKMTNASVEGIREKLAELATERAAAMDAMEQAMGREQQAQQEQQQTFTRPVRLYDEPREELAAPVNFQEETEKAEEAATPALSQADACLNERLGKSAPSAPSAPSAEPVIGWTSPSEIERIAERHRKELEAAHVPDVAVATVGELIDRLSIVNVKIYHLEDTVRESEDTETVCAAAKKTRELNRERSALKNAITRAIEGAGARMDIKLGK